MKSTITGFQPTPDKNFETANGYFHKFIITLSDGISGSIAAKDANPSFLQAGQELEYTYTDHETYGRQLKRVTDQQQGGGGFSGGGKKNFDNSGTIAGWAITQSIAMGNKEPKEIFQGAQILLRMSDSIATSVKAGAYKATEQVQQAQVAAAIPTVPAPVPMPAPREQAPIQQAVQATHIPDNNGDDLPF